MTKNLHTEEKIFNRSLKLNYDDCNISFEIFYRDLSPEELSTIEAEVQDAVRAFQESFYRLDTGPHNAILKKIKMYVFKNREEYVRLGENLSINVKNGGITYTAIEKNVIKADIYVYMDFTAIRNLKHEIIHAVMANVLADLPSALVEGVADYIENGGKNVSRTRLQRAWLKLGGNMSLKSLLEMDSKQSGSVYDGGLLLVAFFEHKFPYYIDGLLEGIARGEPGRIDSEKYEQNFKDWLGDVGLGVTDKDAYLVKPSNHARGGIYEVAIVDSDGYDIGYLPLTEYMFFQNTFRVSSTGTGTRDNYDVSHQYTFMKTVLNDERYWGLLCDKEGNSYYATPEFKLQTNKMFEEKLESTKKVDFLEKLVRGKNISGSDLAALHRHLDETKKAELEDIEKRLGSTEWIDYLKYIDLANLDKKELQQAHENGEILEVKTSSKGDVHKMYTAASVYRLGTKIGELCTGISYFVKSEQGEYFIHRDSSINMHICFNGPCYITKHEGQLHFVSGMTDSQPPGIKINPFFQLDPCYLKSAEHFARLQPNIVVPPETNLMNSNEYVIERGNLLDNKGTTREFDDVFEAVLKKQGKIISILRYIGMYSIEDTILIENFGRGIRYQLGSNAQWLKLVEDHDGLLYLTPWVRETNKPWHDGLLLDPSIIHTYDNGKKSGLVDIASFEKGSLFECKPKEGTVQVYTTNGLHLGQMVSEQHTFIHKIFLSADYNYSYVDFLTSKYPNIIREGDYFRYAIGESDYPTNKEYSKHQRIYVKLR